MSESVPLKTACTKKRALVSYLEVRFKKGGTKFKQKARDLK
jgi:hypothetical protein